MIRLMAIKIPEWLAEMKPTKRDEQNRLAAGLYPKRDGWYKSIDGKTRYVCKPRPVADAIKSLALKFGGHAKGRTVVVGATISLDDLIEMFLVSMFDRMGGALGNPMKRGTYDDYVRVLSRFTQAVGGRRLAGSIGPADFTAFMRTLAGKAPSTVRREIQYVDRLFNWAGPGKKTMNLIPFAVRGPDWIKPADDDLATTASDSDKAYAVKQIAAAFDKVRDDPLLRAAGLLGLNGAFAPIDVAMLPEAIVDLDAAEIRFPREKTGFARLCPLMPDTVAALREYLKYRKKFRSVQPDAAHLMFRTRQGHCLFKWWMGGGKGKERDVTDAGYRNNRLSRRWSEAVGLPFSGLRSTFATLADDWSDQRAIDVVMGHSVGKTGRHVRRKHYAKKFNADRTRRLVEYVWQQAFPGAAASTPLPSPGAAIP